MDDLISRQAAINAITAIDEGFNMDIFTNEVREILRDLPSVQERKGRWIPIQRGFFNKEVTQVKCDQCGHLLDLIGVNCGRGNANFCPNCGAHMDEVE